MTLDTLKRWVPWLWLVVMVAAGAWVYHELRRFSLNDISQALRQMKASRLILAGLFTVGSYACLTFGDLLAVRTLGSDLAYRRVALAAFVSLSIGHTLGFAPFSSGAIRYRFYGQWGLSAEQVAKIMLFSAATITVGETGLAGVALIGNPSFAAGILGIPSGLVRLLGVIFLFIPAGYLVLTALKRTSFHILRWSFELPTLRVASLQVAIGVANYLLVGAALHQAILSTAPVGYFAVATAYLLANVAALVSHTPGGIGVIEVVVMKLLPKAHALGPVLAFRVVYFLVPFAVGILLLLAAELSRRLRPERSSAPAAASAR